MQFHEYCLQIFTFSPQQSLVLVYDCFFFSSSSFCVVFLAPLAGGGLSLNIKKAYEAKV